MKPRYPFVDGCFSLASCVFLKAADSEAAPFVRLDCERAPNQPLIDHDLRDLRCDSSVEIRLALLT